MASCLNCGTENPDGFRFCGACGVAFPEAALDARKIVTVLFCDLVGYTSASERLDPEAVRRTQVRYFETARLALEAHGGTVEKFIGDAVMAVFGIPQAREDDALRALRAAIELRQAIEVLGLQARIGVNTGEVVAGSGDALVTGDAVNTASRLEHAAPPGSILLGEQTLRLCRGRIEVEPVPPLSLKGKRDPVPAHILLGIDEDMRPSELASNAPMVGRDRELGSLERSFERVVSEGRSSVALVSGAAGIGKSRIAAEFAACIADRASILTGRCLSYGEGLTYWPLREAFRQAEGEETLERALTFASREETFREIRTFLEERARIRPVVMILDDLHWAQATLLDLIEHIRLFGDAPILIVGLTRSELFDAHPSWGVPRARTMLVQLERLSDTESQRLLTERHQGETLDAATRRAITERAEGNPLFLEELLAMAVESRGDPGEHEPIPTTIHALLLARLERLPEGQRRVAELASIDGKTFDRIAVEALASPMPREAVREHLAALVRTGLINPLRSSSRKGEDFGFRHQLLRDTAYLRLPKVERASMHERLATWLERDQGDRDPDYDEIAGYHLEQAARFRTEIDPADERIPPLEARSADHLMHAGERAFARSDMPTAASLLRRATNLLGPGTPTRVRILPQLGAAMSAAGDFTGAEEVLVQARTEAQLAGDRVAEALATAESALLRLNVDPDRSAAQARSEGARLVAAFDGSGEHRALARAWYLIGFADLYDDRFQDMERAMSASAEHAAQARDQRQRSAALHSLASAISLGPTPALDAISRLQRMHATITSGSEAEAGVLVNLGVVTAMTGRIDDARRQIASGRAIYHALGMEVMHAANAVQLSMAEDMAGDPAIAEPELRAACRTLEDMGERDFLSTASAFLARVLADLGVDEEAEDWTRTSEKLTAPDDIHSQTTWRSARARVLARRDEHEEAARLATEAVEIAERGEAPMLIGDALMDLAEVSLWGAADQVPGFVERAMSCFQRKGAVVPAERARSWLRTAQR